MALSDHGQQVATHCFCPPDIGLTSLNSLGVPTPAMVKRNCGSGDCDYSGACEILLAFHYPQDGTASTAGINFACELATAIGLDSVELLQAALDSIDSERVQLLMALEGPVTQVRRLDDELLAIFGDENIEKTKDIGNVVSRSSHLA